MGGGKSNCREEREWALLVLCLNMCVYNSVYLFLGWPQYTQQVFLGIHVDGCIGG